MNRFDELGEDVQTIFLAGRLTYVQAKQSSDTLTSFSIQKKLSKGSQPRVLILIIKAGQRATSGGFEEHEIFPGFLAVSHDVHHLHIEIY